MVQQDFYREESNIEFNGPLRTFKYIKDIKLNVPIRTIKRLGGSWNGPTHFEVLNLKSYQYLLSVTNNSEKLNLTSSAILDAVSGKCPGFCKCLRFSKSGFAKFSNSAGHQYWPEI